MCGNYNFNGFLKLQPCEEDVNLSGAMACDKGQPTSWSTTSVPLTTPGRAAHSATIL
jgi:hypothetical protein